MASYQLSSKRGGWDGPLRVKLEINRQTLIDSFANAAPVGKHEHDKIGGSYRLPEVMAASGAILREVGATNKTHLNDYSRAIGEQTAALMLVHPSNYVVVGFSESVELQPLVDLGRRHKLLVISGPTWCDQLIIYSFRSLLSLL